MIFHDPETGQPWFVVRQSRNKRGYWREGEPRPGVTEDDPPRYRKHTLAELLEAGAAADIGMGTEDAAKQVYEMKRRAIREVRDRGALADAGIQAGVTRHTLLGRRREIKRMAYYTRRAEIEDALRSAGLDDDEIAEYLDTWDNDADIRIVENREGGRTFFQLYDETNKQIGRDYDLAELQEIATLGTELEAEFGEWKERQEEARALLDQLEAAGVTVEELGFDPADVPDMLA